MTETTFRSALVTGGAGFIGTWLLPALSQVCERITVFDNLLAQVHGEDAAPPRLPADGLFILGDMRDRDAVQKAVADAAPDLVIHLAAETGTGQSYDEISRYCAVNVQGTAFLAEALRALPPAPRRVVLASSRAVYGEGAYRATDGRMVVPAARHSEDMAAGRFVPRDSDGQTLAPIPTPEDAPVNPGSIYASTKLMQEFILAQALTGSPIKLSILRFQNVYGPGQSLRNPYTGVLSIFGGLIMRGAGLDIFEDGQITRDFVHAQDVVRAIVAAATAHEASSTPINIGTGEGLTILGAARALAAALERPDATLTVTGHYRIGDIRHARADVGRAKTLLGWESTVTFEQGVGELSKWITAGFAT